MISVVVIVMKFSASKVSLYLPLFGKSENACCETNSSKQNGSKIVSDQSVIYLFFRVFVISLGHLLPIHLALFTFHAFNVVYEMIEFVVSGFVLISNFGTVQYLSTSNVTLFCIYCIYCSCCVDLKF